MKITAKEDKELPVTPLNEPSFDNKLELLKYSAQVQSRIKKDISEDFTLAKLPEQDKEGIIEMTSNAYFMKKIMQIIKIKGTRWDWDIQRKTWKRRSLNTDEQKIIEEVAEATFDAYLVRIYMTVILNRNVAENHLLRILAQAGEEEQESSLDSVKEKINELIKPDNQKEQTL